MIRWAWDPEKARRNLAKHGVSFALAERVFGDPWSASRADSHSGEPRFQTIGRPSADSPVTLLVVHTEPTLLADGDEQGRIISARVATPHERRAYEEGKF